MARMFDFFGVNKGIIEAGEVEIAPILPSVGPNVGIVEVIAAFRRTNEDGTSFSVSQGGS